MSNTFCSKNSMAEQLGYSPYTLKAIRQRRDWLEGLHFVRPNSRVIRYNRELCLDWLANINDPEAHQKAIDKYGSSGLTMLG